MSSSLTVSFVFLFHFLLRMYNSFPILEQPIEDVEIDIFESLDLPIPKNTFKSNDSKIVFYSVDTTTLPSWLNIETSFVGYGYEGKTDFSGDVKHSTTKGNYAYLGTGAFGLIIIDVTDPQNPTFVSGYQSENINVFHVVVKGDYVYLLSDPVKENEKLIILDVSDIENPLYVGVCVFPFNDITSFVVETNQDYGYACNDENGIIIFNLKEKENPFIESYDEDLEIKSLDLRSNLLFTCSVEYQPTYSHVIRIYDISTNRSKPTLVSQTPFPTLVFFDCQVYADRTKDYLYALTPYYEMYKVVFLDISNLNNPTIAGGYGVGFTSFPFFLYAYSDYVYLSDGVGDLLILDVSDKTNPILAATYNYYSMHDLYIDPSTPSIAYVASTSGLQMLDISNLENVHLKKMFTTRINCNKHYIFDDIVYGIIRGNENMIMLDTSDNPLIPKLQHIQELPHRLNEIFVDVETKYLYASTEDGVFIYSTENNYELLGQYPLEGTPLYSVHDIIIERRILADVTDGLTTTTESTIGYVLLQNEFRILKINSFTDIEVISSIPNFGYSSFFGHMNPGSDYLYVLQILALKIVDISDPYSPLVVGVIIPEDNHYCNDFCISEDEKIVYISHGPTYYDYISVIDISDPSNPVKISSIRPSVGTSVNSIIVFGDYMYISLGVEGAAILDYNDIHNPVIFAPILSSTVVLYAKVVVQNRYLYFTSTYSDIGIIDLESEIYDLVGTPKNGDCGSFEVTVEALDQTGFNTVSVGIKVSGLGYFDQECSIFKCGGVLNNDSNVCHSRGNCTESREDGATCDCQGNWDGLDFCSGCVNGAFGDSCDITECNNKLSNETNVTCSNHGECLPLRCSCHTDYYGVDCSVTTCNNFFSNFSDNSKICNGHGKCVSYDACLCASPYQGGFCEELGFCGKYMANDTSYVCNGHGDCERFGAGIYACMCKPGYDNPFNVNECILKKNNDDDLNAKTNEKGNSQGILIVILSSTGSIILLSAVIFLISMCCVCCCCVVLVFCCCVLVIFPKYYGAARVYKKRSNSGDKSLSHHLLEEESEIGKNAIMNLKIDKSIFKVKGSEIHLVSVIGSGGSDSTVYKASFNGTEVAFKRFNSSRVCKSQKMYDNFEKEVKILSSISHPFTLRFYGALLEPPRVGILMEYCENGDLFCFLEEREGYPIIERIRILMEISKAMNFLHSRNIIHRDLKPENVLLDGEEHCKVTDFGSSRFFLESAVSENHMTQRLGTPYYMAPEITKGSGYDEKVDVFSFSILCFVVITGDFEPYKQEFMGCIEFRVANDPSFRPNEKRIMHVSGRMGIGENFNEGEDGLNWLVDIIRKCWDADPQKRYSFAKICELFNFFVKVRREEKMELLRDILVVQEDDILVDSEEEESFL